MILNHTQEAESLRNQNQAELRVLSELKGLEWLYARFVEGKRYVRHSHPTYVIGVVESGIEGFWYRGSSQAAGAKQIVAINPEEPHDGYPVGGYFCYRMLYPSRQLINQVMAHQGGTLYFPKPVINDPQLAQEIATVHAQLNQEISLENEIAFHSVINRLIQRHGRGNCQTLTSRRKGYPNVDKARDYIESHLCERVSLEEVCELTDLPAHTLCRAFARQFGMPPHTYQINRRIQLARNLLASQKSITTVALELGFSDQSHFHRRFRERVGVSPGHYQRACKTIQDKR
ncbi:MAG: AraC family transcriptional regulator [Halothece sp.]